MATGIPRVQRENCTGLCFAGDMESRGLADLIGDLGKVGAELQAHHYVLGRGKPEASRDPMPDTECCQSEKRTFERSVRLGFWADVCPIHGAAAVLEEDNEPGKKRASNVTGSLTVEEG